MLSKMLRRFSQPTLGPKGDPTGRLERFPWPTARSAHWTGRAMLSKSVFQKANLDKSGTREVF